MEKEKERLLPRTVQEDQKGDGSKLKMKPKPMTRKGVIAALSYMACSGTQCPSPTPFFSL